MRKAPAMLLAASIVGALLTTSVFAAEEKKEETGQDIAFNNRKGNCLACHSIPGDPKAVTIANIGPPLIAMKARFPDKSKLRAQIWDATAANPYTSMPPFGKHKILSEQEIDKVVDYVYGL
ncbi:sulfur oxidation c-type cytochrome SoxX [Thiobacter aerophilum]|uniref:Sulfur oxidation c-type cytochrome SoxX n=1 Tax=Thiobacter aerophilum TaxID=3121275 RepID=A0ABV0EC79_9BURK